MKKTNQFKWILSVLMFCFVLGLQSVSTNAYTTSLGTSYTWRMSNDFTGTGSKTLPFGWKMHRDNTWPTAGVYSKVALDTVPAKSCVVFKVSSGVEAGKSFQTCFTPTGGKYLLRIGYIHDAWYPSTEKTPLEVTLTTSKSLSVTNQVTASVSGSVNAGFSSLKASVSASTSFNTAFNQTVTYTLTQKYILDPRQFEQHSTIRLRMGYLQRFFEYNATTYRYNPTTKVRGVKVDYINGKKVTGKYLAPNSGPTIVKFWAGY